MVHLLLSFDVHGCFWRRVVWLNCDFCDNYSLFLTYSLIESRSCLDANLGALNQDKFQK